MNSIKFFSGFLVLIAAGTTHAAIITNGSFETTGPGNGNAGAGRYVYVSGVNTNEIAGWVLSGQGDVYIHESPAIGNAIGANFNSAQSGNKYLDLSGGIGGGTSGQHATIYQDFATVASQQYLLDFYIGAAFTPSATINVRLDGASVLLNQTLTALAPSTNILWKHTQLLFTADSALTRLSFRDVSSNDDNVSFVDNVSVQEVSPVPAPASLVLFVLGGIGALATRRTSRNRVATTAP